MRSLQYEEVLELSSKIFEHSEDFIVNLSKENKETYLRLLIIISITLMFNHDVLTKNEIDNFIKEVEHVTIDIALDSYVGDLQCKIINKIN